MKSSNKGRSWSPLKQLRKTFSPSPSSASPPMAEYRQLGKSGLRVSVPIVCAPCLSVHSHPNLSLSAQYGGMSIGNTQWSVGPSRRYARGLTDQLPSLTLAMGPSRGAGDYGCTAPQLLADTQIVVRLGSPRPQGCMGPGDQHLRHCQPLL